MTSAINYGDSDRVTDSLAITYDANNNVTHQFRYSRGLRDKKLIMNIDKYYVWSGLGKLIKDSGRYVRNPYAWDGIQITKDTSIMVRRYILMIIRETACKLYKLATLIILGDTTITM